MSASVLSLLDRASYGAVNEQRPIDGIEQEVILQFQELWEATQAGQSSTRTLPQLYSPAPQPGSIKALVQEQARVKQLQAHARLCLTEDDLRKLEEMLSKYAVPGCPAAAGSAAAIDPNEPRINYDGFSLVASDARAEIGPAAEALFQASTFLKFERDAAGAISLPLFMSYIGRYATSMQLRLQLAAHDDSGSGVLHLEQLQRYLRAAVAAAPLLAGMEPSFLQHYLHIASRKLLLFHGHRILQLQQRKQQQQQQQQQHLRSSSGGGGVGMAVRISDLVSSPVMAELQEILMLGPGADQERDLFNNWFSLQSAQRVLATFTSWDLDGSGTLSKQEFSAISQGAMSELFIARVFEEHVAPQRGAAWPPQQQQPAAAANANSPRSPRSTKLGSLPSIGRSPVGSSPPPSNRGGSAAAASPGIGSYGDSSSSSSRVWPPPLPPDAAGPRDEMDLLAFADFVLAWDHRNHPAAVGYFFKIFDIQHKGYLTLSDLYTFFKEVHALWVAMGEYADLDIYDVLDEIMDMVKPAQQGRITKADLEGCKMAGTVFSILSNVDQFYQYNYRENFMHQEGEEGS